MAVIIVLVLTGLVGKLAVTIDSRPNWLGSSVESYHLVVTIVARPN